MTILAGPALLAARPRIELVPPRVSSAGQECVDLAGRAGLILDPWQRYVLGLALGERPDGTWSAFEVAIIVSRQNGKSAIFEARMLAGLFLFGEGLIIYSAHEFKTAQEIFRRMEELIMGTPDFRRRVRAISRSKGDEGIELTTRQRLRFLARSTGSGRGFSGDTNIWDESQNLGDAPVDALMPTMLARRNPQLWYGGSAPDKDRAPCEQITRVRNRALGGRAATERLAFFEWSATPHTQQCRKDCDQHDDPADPKVWAKTNPALGARISVESIAALHRSMSAAGFAREILSVGNYPSLTGGWDVISEAAWAAVADEASAPTDPVAFGIDVTPDRGWAAIVAVGERADGLTHAEVIDHRPGTGWVVERAQELIAKWSPCAVGMDVAGPAGSLAADFEAAGIELTTPTYADAAAACGGLYDAVVRPPDAADDWASTLRHRPHPALSAALAGARKRPMGSGGAWGWDRRAASVDLCPLVALTVARWAFSRPRTQPAADPWVMSR